MTREEFDAWFEQELLAKLRPVLPPDCDERLVAITERMLNTCGWGSYCHGTVRTLFSKHP